MKSHIIDLLLFLFATLVALFSAQAENFTVKKIKGKQALIETSASLEVGQTYELEREIISQGVDYKTSVSKSRKNSLTLGAELGFLRASTYQSNNYSVQVRYGWNFSNLEAGALFNLVSTDVGVGPTTTVLGGGYIDYNLIANHDPKKIIYGAFALVGIGSTSYPSTSTSGGSSNTLQTNIGGFISYFISNTSSALRGELYGIYQQVSTTTSQNTVTGLGARGLLVFYF